MEEQTGSTTLVMSSKVYDFLKKLAQIWLPALGTLYFALAALWGLPAADKVTGTVMAVDAFLGVLLKFSKDQYVASGAAFDGHVTVIPTDDGNTNVRLNLAPSDLVDKSQITLKVISPGPVLS